MTFNDDLASQLNSIFASNFPSFIFIQDLSSLSAARDVIRKAAEQDVDSKPQGAPGVSYAFVDCKTCFADKILFDTALNALAKHKPGRDFTGRRNDSMDEFLHNLRWLYSDPGPSGNSTVVLVFENIGRLKDLSPRLIYPLSRLQELTRLDLVTVFVSEMEWDDITPTPGTLMDPYRITIDPLSKEEIIAHICSTFRQGVEPTSINLYNPVLAPLFAHFVEAVCNVCFPFSADPNELSYIVCARWPGFVAPVLEEWEGESALEGERECLPLSEESRIRLQRIFNPSLTSAIEQLYPRSMSRDEWSKANSLPSGTYLSQPQGMQLPASQVSKESQEEKKLSVLAMFAVVASFLASYNPAKTDYRMFGRGVDEKSRRRKKGGGTRKTKASTVTKLPQRLVGPLAFTYDRLMAILGSLLREYDESRLTSQGFEDHSELNAEIEVYRTHTSATIRELLACQYIHRSTAQEKLENPTFKCGVGYEQALHLARQLGVPLNELMWEPS